MEWQAGANKPKGFAPASAASVAAADRALNAAWRVAHADRHG